MAPSISDLFRPDAISSETLAVNDQLARTLAANPLPSELADLREGYVKGAFGIPAAPRAPDARTRTIPGPAGDIAARILLPEGAARGAYLFIHGGGWMLGANDMADDQLDLIRREAGYACVSIDYRLAPEHPFPAAVDDCLAAARWLIAHAEREFGTTRLAIGGESAGAYLSVSTLLRLRDAGQGDGFSAANLLFGCYDLSLTPSARLAEDTLVINRAVLEQFVAVFCGDRDLRDPAVSPLYADLAGLPRALFSVGTIDPLLDDTLFLHRRWQAAGNQAELALYPGGFHGFNTMGDTLARTANERVATFLRG